MTQYRYEVTPGDCYIDLNSGGIYEMVGIGTLEETNESVVIYQSEQTDRLYARSVLQFFDGRFRLID